jgi:hypothetical protein
MAWTAGQLLTAAQMNTYIPQASTTFTPTFTNLTVGNGTLTAREANIGPMVINTIRLVWGSTTAITGSPTFTCSEAALSIAPTVATVELEDASASTVYQGVAERSSTTALFLRAIATASTNATHAALSSTVPFTWTTNDQIRIALIFLTL